MATRIAQKMEFTRYQNEFNLSFNKPMKTNIICFRCNGNHHIKHCTICAYCKDMDNPHHIKDCPKTNYCSYCKGIVGHNIKKCPYINNTQPILNKSKEKQKIEFSYYILQEDSDSDSESDLFIDCPELPKIVSKPNYISQFSREYKMLQHKAIMKIQYWWRNILINIRLQNIKLREYEETYLKELKKFSYESDSSYSDNSIIDWNEIIDWDNVSDIKIDFTENC